LVPQAARITCGRTISRSAADSDIEDIAWRALLKEEVLVRVSGAKLGRSPQARSGTVVIPLSLDQLTVIDLLPLEFVRTAARAGYRFVSLFVHSPAPDFLPALRPSLAAAMRSTLADCGVAVGNLECFDLSGAHRIASFRESLELGAGLGARLATAINYREADPARAADRLAEFSVLCGDHGLRPCVEPFSTGRTRTVCDAVTLIGASGLQGAGIVIDALHFFRTGGTVAELADLPAGIIACAQLCDAPAQASDAPGDLEREATGGRLDPGEGELPLVDLLAALPPEVLLAVEAPNAARRAAGETAQQRAAAAWRATQNLLARAWQDGRTG
jgi:sugar phosphate isomerase/epimerase